MNKLFGFFAGALCGAVVGATASILFSPQSGEDLRAQAVARWEAALSEARGEMQRTQRDLETNFTHLKAA